MFASWTPLLPSQRAEEQIEEFTINMTPEQKSTVVNVLTGVGLMTLGITVALIFAWAYTKDRTLFIAIMGVVAFAFSINMLIYIFIIRENMSQHAFNYYLGVTIFSSFVNFLIFVMFITMYVRRS